MEAFGVTREGFGRLCIMQRANASTYPQALFRKPLTMESYLHARMVADPLGLFDCVLPCAGAEGVLVMTEARATSLELPYARLTASAERHNAAREAELPLAFGWGDFRDELYNAAGYGPGEIDIAQVYDDYPVMALLQLEELGLCPAGQASRHLSDQGFAIGNRTIPVNTSGGQLSSGQAGFAGGFLGFVEAVRQLTGQALGNQRTDLRTAIVSRFGMINYDRGLCTAAAILEQGT